MSLSESEGMDDIVARAKIGLDQYAGGGAACGAPRPFLHLQNPAGKNIELCINTDG